MRSFARLILLTLVVGGLIAPAISAAAYAAMPGSATAMVAAQDPAGISCDHANGHQKPFGFTHHPDCCIAGICAMSAGIPATAAAPAGPFYAGLIAYAPRAPAEPRGVDAIPKTHPPQAAV